MLHHCSCGYPYDHCGSCDHCGPCDHCNPCIAHPIGDYGFHRSSVEHAPEQDQGNVGKDDSGSGDATQASNLNENNNSSATKNK